MLMVELNDKGFLPRADVESEGGSGEGNHDSVLRRIFFVGAGGLRVGWSIALYWVMFGLIAAVENWLADSLQLSKLWSQMFGELGALVAAVIPALVMARIERRPWGDYGLPLRQAFSKLFWVGAVWGFLGITLLLEILHGLHAFDFGHVVLHGITIVRYAIFWGVVFLLVGLVEEFLFRGYTLFTLGRGLGFWPTAALL
jgi:membrane protease YdiL (CAAX protease family)